MSRISSFASNVRSHGLVTTLRNAAERRLMRVLPRSQLGDLCYAYLQFREFQGRSPDPSAPLLNDYWYSLKISGELENPLRVFVTDKEFLKLFVKATVGDEHNVPTLAVLHTADEIRRYVFPDRCCIKATHSSGLTIIRSHGEALDIDHIIRWLDFDYYVASREQNYRTLAPKVIVEPLIFDSANVEDYKFFCFDGEPKLIQVDIDRWGRHTKKLYTSGWLDTGCSIDVPMSIADIPRPKKLDRMLELARELSRPFSSMRVDLYTDGERVLVGELTSCHGGAQQRFIPQEAEETISAICLSGRPHITAALSEGPA